MNRFNKITVYLLFLFCFSLYVKTAAPEPYTADCGEMAASAHVLGIPHPTGYALYNQLNHAGIILIPFGTSAFRCSLVSALFSAFSVAIFYLLLISFFAYTSAAVVSLLFSISFTFWSQSNIQEVYSLHIFFLALIIYLTVKSARTGSLKFLTLLSFVTGLSMTHHLLTIFMAPPVIFYLLVHHNRFDSVKPKIATQVSLFLILGASCLVYFPIRSSVNCAIRWMNCDHWHRFVYHITGRQFRTIMFNVTLEELYNNLLFYLDKYRIQTGSFTMIFLVIGFVVLFFKYRYLFWFCLSGSVSVAAFFLTYRIVDIEVYYLQSYLYFLIACCAGVYWIDRRISRFLKLKATGLLAILLLISIHVLMIRSYYFNNRSQGRVAYDWGISLYNTARPGAILVTQGWSSPFMFFYLDHVLGYRRDLSMQVDYKGTIFTKSYHKQWDSPVDATVQLDLPLLPEKMFHVSGLLYHFEKTPPSEEVKYLSHQVLRNRCFNDSSIFLDFHGTGLKAKKEMMLGQSELQNGHQDSGIKHLVKAEKTAPENPLILSNLSGVYFQNGFWEEAIRLAKASIEQSPRFYPAYHNLGNALLKLGDYAGALEAYIAVDDYNHALGRQREALGFAFLNQGECRRAIMEYRRALDATGDSPATRVGLGLAMLRCDRHAEALELFSEAIDLAPDTLEYRMNRAVTYIEMGRYESAIEDLHFVLDRDEGNREVLVNLGVAFAAQGNYSRATEILEDLYLTDGSNVTLLNNLAFLYYLNGKYLKSIELWESSLDIDPTQSHIARNLRRSRFEHQFFQ